METKDCRPVAADLLPSAAWTRAGHSGNEEEGVTRSLDSWTATFLIIHRATRGRCRTSSRVVTFESMHPSFLFWSNVLCENI